MIAIHIKDQITFQEFETMNWLNIQRTLQKWSVRKKSGPLPISDISEVEFLNLLFYLILHAYDLTIKNDMEFVPEQNYYVQYNRLFQFWNEGIGFLKNSQNKNFEHLTQGSKIQLPLLLNKISRMTTPVSAVENYGNYLVLSEMDYLHKRTQPYNTINNYSQEIVRQERMDPNDFVNQVHLLYFISKIHKILKTFSV